LYLHGIIKPFSITSPEFGKICRFTSPFIQDCLYYALTDEIIGDERAILPLNAIKLRLCRVDIACRVSTDIYILIRWIRGAISTLHVWIFLNLMALILPLDPLDELSDVFTSRSLNIPALLTRYKDYLERLRAKDINPWKEQPRRKTDLQLIEAVGHFHLFSWLRDAVRDDCIVSPEFPAGNRQVDLHLRCGNQRGIIEVKSFVKHSQIKDAQDQAADYAKKLSLDIIIGWRDRDFAPN